MLCPIKLSFDEEELLEVQGGASIPSSRSAEVSETSAAPGRDARGLAGANDILFSNGDEGDELRGSRYQPLVAGACWC